MLDNKRNRLATIGLRDMTQLVGLIAVGIVIDDGNSRRGIRLIGNHCLHDAAFHDDGQPLQHGLAGAASIRTRPGCLKRRLVGLIQIVPVDAAAPFLTAAVGLDQQPDA